MRVLLGFLILALLSYLFVDFPLIELISPLRSKLRLLMKGTSLLIFPPFHLVLWTGAFLFARFLSAEKKWTLPFFEIALSQYLSVAFVRIFKVVIGRARPESFLSKNVTGFDFFSGDHYFHSLPSGHTMAAFTLAASIALLFPRFRVISLIIAFHFSMARIYLLDHFPSDIFATAVIGIFIAQMVHTLINKIAYRYDRRELYEETFT